MNRLYGQFVFLYNKSMRNDKQPADLIKGNLLLAPMAGTTDAAYRTVCRELGAVLTHTEMVSARGLSRGSTFAARTAVFDRMERPIAVQVYAGTPDVLEMGIRELERVRPDVIDINAGCPAAEVTRTGAGAALLANVAKLRLLVRRAVQATSIPVSVKVRVGTHARREEIVDIARAVEDAGAAWLTVHGRSRYTRYDVPADWEAIRHAREQVRIPVVGNGDVFSAADALRMMRETGCDAVLVARGSLGYPWIFRDFEELRAGRIPPPVTAEVVAPVLRRHIDLTVRNLGEIMALPRVRKNVCWYTRYFAGAPSLRREIFSREEIPFIRDAALRFLEADPPLLPADAPERAAIDAAFRRRVLFWMNGETEIDDY